MTASTATASTTVDVSLRVAAPPPSALDVLTAAADPIRWTVLAALGDGRRCVCDLQAHIPVAPNLLSYHLKVLREAGLVTASRRGRWMDYELAADAHARLAAALPTAAAGGADRP